MKNIISIDFDIIMAPDINKYNDFVDAIRWEAMEQLGIRADFIHYKRLTDWLMRMTDKISKDNVFFIEDHSQIIKYIPLEEEIHLYNIDHHHDCGYKGSAETELNCGNWVCKIPNLKKYTWINNMESQYNAKDSKIELISEQISLAKCNLDLLPIPDKIILCLSVPWVPPQHRELFFLWKDILEKCYSAEFKIDLLEGE